MLYEFSDIIDPKELPRRLSHLKWHITGFIDGDGSFPVILSPDPSKRFGWLIQPRFEVELRRSDDSMIMLKIISRAMVIHAKIREGDNNLKLIVTNRRLLLEKVIPFFLRYRPVIKWAEFSLMRYVAESLQAGKHLSYDGFREIVRRIFSLPANGETRRKWMIEDIIPGEKPLEYEWPKPRFPKGVVALKHYTAGFIDAEGCLGYAVNRATRSITPYLTITHRELEVLRRIKQVLGCGEISGGRLQIYGIENICSRVIPFLDRQKLIAKRSTYKRFKHILNMILNKEHKRDFNKVLKLVKALNKPARGSSETIRRAPSAEGEDMVQHP